MRKSILKAICRRCMLAGLLVISLLTMSPGILHAQATHAASGGIGNGSIQWPQGQALQQVIAGWDGDSSLFVSILLNGWNDPPADATYLVQNLNANSVVVRGDQFFQLFREANGLPPVE